MNEAVNSLWPLTLVNSSLLGDILLLTFTCLAIWISGTWIYNFYLHPLREFPGPKFAAMTDLWKAHVELVQQRGIVEKLFELHSVYGDIVRIGPNELHFANPTAYDDIYNTNNRWTKEKYMYMVFGEPGANYSSFTTRDYATAKKRKDVLTPLFSRRAIIELQSLVQEKMTTLCDIIAVRSKEGLKSNLEQGFKCFSLDTITSFCFARSMNALRSPNFDSTTIHAMKAALPLLILFKHFPVLHWVVFAIPNWVNALLNPTLKGYQDLGKIIEDQIDEILFNPSILLENSEHPTIYHALISCKVSNPTSKSSDNRHDELSKPLSKKELLAEAWALIYAGTDTVANTLTMGCFYILDPSNVDIYDKLKRELLDAWPTLDEGVPSPTYEELEKLPYLKAVIKESLRFSHGIIWPMNRYVPSNGAMISGVYVPGGTVVGISNAMVNLNETLYPNPLVFKPERWLGGGISDNESNKMTVADIVSFGRGPRSCLGINLAYCDLYIAFANFFRRFHQVEISKGAGLKEMIWKESFTYNYFGPPFEVTATPSER
ncbi:cytochrome P450 [Abortiporus biennis]|nr:cytochrome P450 [Abortiporus biennis]